MFENFTFEKLFKNRPLSLEKYNAVIGAVLLEGILVSIFASNLLTGMLSLFIKSWLTNLICYVIVCAIGILISYKSTSPKASLLGYNIVMISTSIFLSLLLRTVETDLVKHALWITAGVVAIMLVAVYLMPKIYLRLKRAMIVAAIGLIIIGAIAYFAGWFKISWWGALIAAIFALYISYVWANAQKNELMLDNAIDSCLGLYMGLAELFSRLFRPLQGKTGITKKLKNARAKMKNLFDD